MPKFIDLTGQKIGRLIVIKHTGKDKWNHSLWSCRCVCGKIKVATTSDLNNHRIQSCGCLKTIHGLSKHPCYPVWKEMVYRCTNPNHRDWKDWGGRGITVCRRWRKFENFLKDMGECPAGCQLDRENNNEGYSPENCRWTTAKINSRNRRDNHLIEYNGKTQCLAAWSEETGIHAHTIGDRIDRGWSIEKALTTPVKRRKNKLKLTPNKVVLIRQLYSTNATLSNKEKLSQSQIAKMFGVSEYTIWAIINEKTWKHLL